MSRYQAPPAIPYQHKCLQQRLSVHRYGVSENGIACKGNEKIDYSYLFHELFLAVRIKKLMFGHTKKTYCAQTHHSLRF